MEHHCANCYVEEGINAVPYRDVTDTDRGDWVQEGTEYLCDDCLEEVEDEAHRLL